MAEQVANFGHTTLNEGAQLSTTDTTVTVTDGSVFPSSGDFRVRVDDELMIVTARATNNLTVTRGAEGTTATTHDDGSDIDARLTADGLVQIIDENSDKALDDITDVNLAGSGDGDSLVLDGSYSVGSLITNPGTATGTATNPQYARINNTQYARLTTGETVIYDFGSSKRCARARVKQDNTGNYMTSATWACSDDNVAYTDVHTATGMTNNDASYTFDDKSQEGRYWRVTCDAYTGSRCEMEFMQYSETDATEEWKPEPTPRECTSFPTSPVTGWRRRRTDLDNEIYFYDGTQWVSEQIYEWKHWHSSGLTSTTAIVQRMHLGSDDIYVLDIEALCYYATGGDASNYFTLQLEKVTVANVYSSFGPSLACQPATTSNWTKFTGAVDTVLDVGTHPLGLNMKATETGTANVTLAFVVKYRRIAT